ncbi:MAG: hypothetical protein LH613_08235 [Chamaesiphon sp.]|nr:hypothetical protein [Chamaesiphon sp.]
MIFIVKESGLSDGVLTVITYSRICDKLAIYGIEWMVDGDCLSIEVVREYFLFSQA